VDSNKETLPDVLARMIREIEVSGDWFGCVLVISFDVSLVFAESPPCFTNVYLFA